MLNISALPLRCGRMSLQTLNGLFWFVRSLLNAKQTTVQASGNVAFCFSFYTFNLEFV